MYVEQHFDVRPISQQFRHGAAEFEVFETRHTPGKLCFGALINGWLMYSGDTLLPLEIGSHSTRADSADFRCTSQTPYMPA